MSFGHEKVLWLGAVVLPLLILFLWATWRKRQALVRQFVQHKTLAQMSLGVSAGRQKLRRVLLVGAVLFLLLAVARPQWGFIWEEAAQRGRDIVIAIDTSRSMLAADLQPNRLVRAKLAALDLVKLAQFDRFGLVAFAGTAFLQCPLTFDEEAFRQSVEILEPGLIPQGGTAIGPAIDAAREAFGTEAAENHKIIVLFTDGEDHEHGVIETVQQAVGAGIRIFTVGAGTSTGELLRVRDEQGNLVFVKDDQGNVVKSRLNEELLRQIATAASGFYLPLNAPNAMDVLYQKGLAPLPTSERTTKLMKRMKEQFYWPLSIAILLLIIEVFVPEQKRARRKPETRGLTKAVALLLLFLLAGEVRATPAAAMRKYNNREYKGALEEYQKLIERSPNDPRLHYNAGAAAYHANKLDQAAERFRAAAASPDLDLQQQSFYNLGNTEFRLGESNSNVQERMASWEQALQHYEAALRLNPADADAIHNRDLVKRRLEELKQQQQEQQQQNQQNNQDKNQENKEQQNNQENKEQDQQNQQQQQQNDDQKNQSEPQEKEQNKEQQQQAQNQQGEKQDEKKGEQSQARKQGGEKEGENSDPEQGAQAQYAQLGTMTPAQAKQLLDAQRGEEKALLFIPRDRKSNPRERTFKDW